jgi:hypothetical protein
MPINHTGHIAEFNADETSLPSPDCDANFFNQSFINFLSSGAKVQVSIPKDRGSKMKSSTGNLGFGPSERHKLCI